MSADAAASRTKRRVQVIAAMAEEKKLPDADESADPESQESKEKGPKYDSIVEEQEVKPINLKHFFVVCASVIVFIGLCLAWAGLG